MAALVLIGIATTLFAAEPEKSAPAMPTHARENSLHRVAEAAVGAFSDFLTRDMAFVALAFVVLFKFSDAFVRRDDGAVRYRSRLFAERIRRHHQGRRACGNADRRFCRRFSGARLFAAVKLLDRRRVAGLANLAFSWQAVFGHEFAWLTVAIIAENFTSAIGTVIFVAYLSALCRNPLHTATQYALLTALAAFGRTYLSSGAGFIAAATGWAGFFVICALAGLPALVLLAWLQTAPSFRRLGAGQEKTALGRARRINRSSDLRACRCALNASGERNAPAAQKARKKVLL